MRAEMVAAAHRAQADALEIEAQAKRRLADEYDAAQDRGEAQKAGGRRGNQHVAIVAGENNGAKVADLGLTRLQVHEARRLRDAEDKAPGVIRRTLDARLERGEEPTKAAVRQAVAEVIDITARVNAVPPAAEVERDRRPIGPRLRPASFWGISPISLGVAPVRTHERMVNAGGPVMSPPCNPDLFTAAGLPSATEPARRPKRKPPPPTPSERAASGRLGGARRFRAPQRERIGPPRDLAPATVLAFPLHRNAVELGKMSARVPKGYSRELELQCDREALKLEKRLLYKGINKRSARRCARDLPHEVYMQRVIEAEQEM